MLCNVYRPLTMGWEEDDWFWEWVGLVSMHRASRVYKLPRLVRQKVLSCYTLYSILKLQYQYLVLPLDQLFTQTPYILVISYPIPMLSTQAHVSVKTSRQAAQLGKAAAIGFVRTSSSSSSLVGCPAGIRLGAVASIQNHQARLFSTTPATQLRDFFPVKETAHIQTTPPAWPHHGYSFEEMNSVEPAHRPPRGLGDKAAWRIVRLARYCMDKATGMERSQQVDKKNPTTAIAASKPLTESQWVS